MSDRELKDLLDLYVKGKCSDEERRIINSWYSQISEFSVPNMTEDERIVTRNKLLGKIKKRIDNAK